MNYKAPRLSEVVVAEGRTVRVCAETASRDFTAAVVPGTYALVYTDSNYRPVRDGQEPYYVYADVLIDTPDRVESSVEFGGVRVASQKVAGKRIAHTLSWYAYQTPKV